MKNNICLQNNKDRWDEIIKKFREACYLYHYEEKSNATTILEKKLPKMIKEWQKASGLEEDKTKQKIKRSFSIEQLRVANAFLLRKAFQEETLKEDLYKYAAYRANVIISNICWMF